MMIDQIDPKFIGFITKLDKPAEIINTYKTWDGEKWTDQPGRVICTMGLVDERYYDEKIENIFSSYNNIDRNEAFLNCKHKAYAASYHLKTILQEFNIVFEQYKNGERSTGAGVNYEHENHILIYETESFLFQIKSNLDLIITFLKDYIPCLKSFRSFKHSGDEAGKIAGGSILKELDNKGLKEWHDLFEKERINWIQNLVVLRDQITHYSKLKNFVNFIEDPNTENEYTVVYFPKMPTGERLDVYCNNVFNSLSSLYTKIFKIISQSTN